MTTTAEKRDKPTDDDEIGCFWQFKPQCMESFVISFNRWKNNQKGCSNLQSEGAPRQYASLYAKNMPNIAKVEKDAPSLLLMCDSHCVLILQLEQEKCQTSAWVTPAGNQQVTIPRSEPAVPPSDQPEQDGSFQFTSASDSVTVWSLCWTGHLDDLMRKLLFRRTQVLFVQHWCRVQVSCCNRSHICQLMHVCLLLNKSESISDIPFIPPPPPSQSSGDHRTSQPICRKPPFTLQTFLPSIHSFCAPLR